jgi:hypothetical protein
MATEDQILLKLVISGQSPAEVQALAAATQGQLNEKLRGYLDQLTQLHVQAAAAQTAEAVKASKAAIDAAEKQVDTVGKVMRANEIAANRSENAWKSTLRVMESIAISTEFMFNIVGEGLSKFSELGEAITKVTNVYGSLKGSIDEMREASAGEISDMDLILTKNRAMEKDLTLTDAQFAAVAAGAHGFAKTLGIDTKEALDKFVDGLAQGNLKALKHVGIMVDADTAYKTYAKSIGVAADQLSTHGKQIAIVQEALRLNDIKLANASEAVKNFGGTWEQTAAKLKNLWDDILKSLGKMIMMAIEGFTIDLPDGIRLAIAKIKDMLPGGSGNVDKAVAAHEANLAAFYKDDGGEKEKEAAQKRLDAGTSGQYSKGTRADSINEAKVRSDALAAEAAQKKRDEEMAFFDSFLIKLGGGGKGGRSRADEEFDSIMANQTQTAAEKAQMNGPGLGISTGAFGLTGSYARSQAMAKANDNMQANIARSMEATKETNDLSTGVDSKDAMKRMEESLKQSQERIDALRKGAGDGILATMFFGNGGPQGMREKIDAWADDVKDALNMVGDAGKKMGDALGASLAAFVSGDKSKRASIRQTTHDILEALATQAYSRAIFETAEGLAALALGPIGGVTAGMHFAAAGMFAAVGTTAALGARATGITNAPQTQDQTFQAQADNAAAKKQYDQSHGISTSTSGSGGFGSNGVRSTPANNNAGPININVNTMYGSKEEIGRGLNIVLAAYYAQTGQGLPAVQVTG